MSGRSALLAMDLQEDMVARNGVDDEFLQRANEVIVRARSAGMPVIFIKVEFRSGYPEVSPRNLAMSGVKAAGRLVASEPATALHHALSVLPTDIVITKRRFGAFHGTELDVVLRAHEVDTLVLFGLSTTGVVLSTVRAAADLDYSMVVLRDLCADRDPEAHAVLLDRVIPRQASVVTAADWLATLPA